VDRHVAEGEDTSSDIQAGAAIQIPGELWTTPACKVTFLGQFIFEPPYVADFSPHQDLGKIPWVAPLGRVSQVLVITLTQRKIPLNLLTFGSGLKRGTLIEFSPLIKGGGGVNVYHT
jgi:hypothetical protein